MTNKLVFAIIASLAMPMDSIAGISSLNASRANPGDVYHNSLSPMISVSGSTPSPPAGYGAWESINGGPWFKQNNTLSVRTGPSNANASIMTEGDSSLVEGAFGGNGVLTNAVETVSLPQFSGEKDSKWGTNAWSVQLNTNYFIGNNGQTDSVQFGFQNNLYTNYIIYKAHYSQFVISANDVQSNPQIYNVDSISIPIQTLSTALQIEIDANSNGGNLNAQLYITTSSGYTTWSISEPQVYGLSGHWSSVSGTILGAGSSSTAEFTSPTHVTTQIVASAPSSWSPYYSSNDVTLEQNNLNQGAVSGTALFEPQYYYYGYTVTTQSSN